MDQRPAAYRHTSRAFTPAVRCRARQSCRRGRRSTAATAGATAGATWSSASTGRSCGDGRRGRRSGARRTSELACSRCDRRSTETTARTAGEVSPANSWNTLSDNDNNPSRLCCIEPTRVPPTLTITTAKIFNCIFTTTVAYIHTT